MLEFGFDFERNDLRRIAENVAAKLAHHQSFWDGYDLADKGLKPNFRPIPMEGPPPWFGDVKYKRTNKTAAYTYMLQFGDQPIWKVGYTQDLERRLKEINAHLPTEFTGEIWVLREVTHWKNVYRAYEMEQAVLTSLDEYRGLHERLRCERCIIYETWRDKSRIAV